MKHATAPPRPETGREGLDIEDSASELPSHTLYMVGGILSVLT